jgi:hypothetical protein
VGDTSGEYLMFTDWNTNNIRKYVCIIFLCVVWFVMFVLCFVALFVFLFCFMLSFLFYNFSTY